MRTVTLTSEDIRLLLIIAAWADLGESTTEAVRSLHHLARTVVRQDEDGRWNNVDYELVVKE